VAETLLETLLLGQASSTTPSPRCRVVVGGSPVRFNLETLHDALNRSRAGDFVAYAVTLEAPPLLRLCTLVTLALRLRRAARMIERNGGAAVVRYGIDPRLEAPTFVYQLDCAASQYADRFLRARGSGVAFRRLAARCFGYDPALGAVVVVGRKS
jgi:hypothetical protein